jgi:hypothetical protein
MPVDPNRRDFIAALGSAAAWPVAAFGQQRAKAPRLGVLLFSTPKTDPNMEAVHSSLRALGYMEGRDVIVSYRYAEGHPERLISALSAFDHPGGRWCVQILHPDAIRQAP